MDISFLSKAAQEVLEFAQHHHQHQQRKYTNEPYWTHLVAVAKLVNDYTHNENAVCIALCHDLLEDTEATAEQLHQFLLDTKYSVTDCQEIVQGVRELTDQYTSAAYPKLNRQKRKALEAKRLSEISPLAQTVKYADLINNISSIVQYDHSFARTYLDEKRLLLELMQAGNAELYQLAKETYRQSRNFIVDN